ncbi:MAG: DUF692 domain-containing protein [Rhodospirillales bacterium]|nr:DUF692 domain-containing protein [Rhodospirillales bacterium]
MIGPDRACGRCEGAIPQAAGIGLRFAHHRALLDALPPIGWVEVHSENYLSGPALETLEAVRCRYPVSLHCVGLSLGSAQGIDADHLERIATLCARIEPGLVSEHLAWGRVDHAFLADLLPLPLTEESLAVVAANIARMQDRLRRPVLIENPSTYVQFAHTTIPETEFLTHLVARTGCGLICDINNIVVSATNHGWDAQRYLQALPAAAIGEYHLAGHGPVSAVLEGEASSGMLLDTHDRPVAESVWSLFADALRILGPRPALIEWDADLPALAVLLGQADRAAHHLQAVSAQGFDVQPA